MTLDWLWDRPLSYIWAEAERCRRLAIENLGEDALCAYWLRHAHRVETEATPASWWAL